MFVVLFAAACSFFFLRALVPQLRRRLLDQPNAELPQPANPRGGGIACRSDLSVFCDGVAQR